MKQPVLDIIQPLTEEYSLRVKTTKEGCDIVLAGSQYNTISVYDERCDARDEFIVMGEGWHAHVTGDAGLVELLQDLFSGKVQVVVKLSGQHLLGAQLQEVDSEGTTSVRTMTCLLVPHFGKRRYEVVRYKDAIMSVRPIES